MLITRIFGFMSLIISTSLYAQTFSESGTQQYLEKVKNDPKQLNAFLHAMPKGGELHDHLGGAGMAENMITYVKDEHFCLNKQTYTVAVDNKCSKDDLLDNAAKKPEILNAIIDAWSMRNFKEGKESAHDHGFAAFPKFAAILPVHSADILAEMAKRAIDQNELYLEVMITPDENASGALGKRLGWNSSYPLMRTRLLDNGLKNIILEAYNKLTAIEDQYKKILLCQTKTPSPACNLKMNYLYQVYREQAPEQVFAQLLAGFELATADARVVGINMVQAENGPIAMRDYSLHMKMIEYLHGVYPKVHITLHAGESGPAIAPPEALRFHIREAVEIGRAERIGHGLDIAYEELPNQLFRKLARDHILIETTPTTEKILGFEAKDLPFQQYINNNVPVAISTDDEGVFRTNLTEQFQDIVTTYSSSYLVLKKLVRNSIAYSFIKGKALWRDEDYHGVVLECEHDVLGTKTPTSSCAKYLNANEKAKLQWDLEGQFASFELKYS